MGAFDTLHARSLAEPETFWAEAAEAITWTKRWDAVLDRSDPPFYRWFAGAELNTAYNALDRHIAAGRGNQAALIYESPVTGRSETISYHDLTDRVARLAGALKALGVAQGDRVIVYMPMVPQAVEGMLACARLGAVHSVVFGGFAPNELATRIDDAKPKVILSASCGIEPGRTVAYKPMLDLAIAQAQHKPSACIVLQRAELACDLVEGRDHDWRAVTADAVPAQPVAVAATDPLYILYTSGTTGQPKGIVRDNGGHAVALSWTMKDFYGMQPGEVFWAASDVGWVVGHSYIVYAPLIFGCTSVLFEGKPVGTPDAGVYWRVIQDHKVSALFTAPTAFRAIRKEDPDGALMADYDISSLRALFLAGERSDPETIKWAVKKLKVPVVDHWWQTETGWVIAGNPLGVEEFPLKPGSATRPMCGWDIKALDANGQEVPRGDVGALVATLPMPPGTFPTLWQAPDRYRQAYFTDYPGYYKTGDAGYVDEDGYVHVMTRVDDVINVAGHRLSTGAIEEVLAGHPDVAECAVIGVADALKGMLPLGFLVLKAGVNRPDVEIIAEAVKRVREQIGPVAAFKTAVIVDRLPKTRSGKILRGTMKKIADAEPAKVPATIDDPTILDEVAGALRQVGYAKPA